MRDLKQYLIDHNYPNGRDLKSKKHQTFLADLRHHTSFLDQVYTNVSDMTRCFVVLNDIDQLPLCLQCDGYVALGPDRYNTGPYHRHGFRPYCSRSCMTKGTEQKRRQTTKERFGTEHHMHNENIKQSIRQTNQQRYGAPTFLATDQWKETYAKRCYERYGVHHHLAAPEIQAKRAQNNIEKYGAANPFVFARDKIEQTFQDRYGTITPRTEHPDVRGKAEQTNIERYGTRHPAQNSVVQQKIVNTRGEYKHGDPMRSHFSDYTIDVLYDREKLQQVYDQCGSADRVAEHLDVHSHTTILRALHFHQIPVNTNIHRSVGEQDLCDFLDRLGISYDTNAYVLPSGKELDILIPSHNLAIEYNGIYWHSDVYKPRQYHQNKALECAEQGLTLLHVWEDWWLNDRTHNIIKSMIAHQCGFGERVYARSCTIRHIEGGRSFHHNNHIQGRGNGSSHFALVDSCDNIVGVLSVNMHSGTMKIDRYSTSKAVVGGFSKALKAAQQYHQPENIETFASLDYGQGYMYQKCGFTREYITEPNYHYFDQNLNRYTRNQFQKHKLPSILSEFDQQLTEKENVKRNGYMLVYDSGSVKYVMDCYPPK